MGVFDIFLAKDKRDERSREKNIARAVDKYRQSYERMKALEALAADGSEEALYGLLRRFGMNYDKSIDDEQEKEWVCEALVAKGAAALPAVKRAFRNSDSVSWPLRVLAQIAADHDEELRVIEDVLAEHEPGYERDPTKKTQLLSHLGLLKHERAAGLCAPYLEDMDEGVRYAAAESLLKHKNAEVAREPLLKRFCTPQEESLRLRMCIAQGFAELEWSLEGFREQLEKFLPEGFTIARESKAKGKGDARNRDKDKDRELIRKKSGHAA